MSLDFHFVSLLMILHLFYLHNFILFHTQTTHRIICFKMNNFQSITNQIYKQTCVYNTLLWLFLFRSYPSWTMIQWRKRDGTMTRWWKPSFFHHRAVDRALCATTKSKVLIVQTEHDSILNVCFSAAVCCDKNWNN